MSTTEFTLADLCRILTEAAGADGSTAISDDALDTEFEELGYDSLALMETGARIERAYGSRIAEEDLAAALTPRALIDLVNRMTAAA